MLRLYVLILIYPHLRADELLWLNMRTLRHKKISQYLDEIHKFCAFKNIVTDVFKQNRTALSSNLSLRYTAHLIKRVFNWSEHHWNFSFNTTRSCAILFLLMSSTFPNLKPQDEFAVWERRARSGEHVGSCTRIILCFAKNSRSKISRIGLRLETLLPRLHRMLNQG